MSSGLRTVIVIPSPQEEIKQVSKVFLLLFCPEKGQPTFDFQVKV